MIEITEFKIKPDDSSLTTPLILNINDNYERTNYIFIRQSNVELIKKHNYKECLDIIKLIYNEHLKMSILGLPCPVYLFETKDKEPSKLQVSLIGFISGSNILKQYKVKEFVTTISLQMSFKLADTLKGLKQIELNDNVEFLGSMGYGLLECKLLNIRNVKSFNSYVLKNIVHNIERYHNKVLELDRVDTIPPIRFAVPLRGIRKLIFNDTATIKDIPSDFLYGIFDLEEIRLCKSIKTIDNLDINNFIYSKERICRMSNIEEVNLGDRTIIYKEELEDGIYILLKSNIHHYYNRVFKIIE